MCQADQFSDDQKQHHQERLSEALAEHRAENWVLRLTASKQDPAEDTQGSQQQEQDSIPLHFCPRSWSQLGSRVEVKVEKCHCKSKWPFSFKDTCGSWGIHVHLLMGSGHLKNTCHMKKEKKRKKKRTVASQALSPLSLGMTKTSNEFQRVVGSGVSAGRRKHSKVK